MNSNYLTTDKIKVILQNAPQGVNPDDVVKGLVSRGYILQGLNDQPTPPDNSYNTAMGIKNPDGTPKSATVSPADISNAGKNISSAFQGGVNQVKEGYNQAKNATNILQLLEGGTNLAAGAINTVLSPAAPVGAVINEVGVKPTSNLISDIPAVQKFAGSKAGEITNRAVTDVNNLNTVAGGVAGAMELPKTISSIKDNVSNAIDKIQNPPPKPPAVLDESKITDLYNRAIKPSVSGKGNAGAIEKANSQVVTGLKSIADNKANLVFNGADGETITGATPKTVDQLTQSIAQTKSSIFKQYDALAKQAGEAGITVDGSNIGSELQPVIDSKSLAISNPAAVKYAQAMQERLTQGGAIDAQTAQDVIQHFNETLKAFYQNPTYESATNASIDALVANKFREALDNGISNSSGEQYGALKKQYGALSSMEKDVTRRAIVWGRQNPVGLTANIANVASGVELVRGLTSLNPVDLASAATIKGIQMYMKYLNNPDAGVAKIFSSIEKSSPTATESTAPQATPKQVKSSSAKPTISKTKVKK